jgi:hypothetical protein
LVAAAAVVALLAVAVLKPWGPPAPRPTANAAATANASAQRAAATPDRAAGSITCWSQQEWRAVTVERSAGRAIVSWMAVAPVMVEGPDDPRIPLLRVVADRVTGLGYCAPATIPTAADALGTSMTAWLRSDDGEAVQLGPLEPAAVLSEDAAVVFRLAGSSWRPGTYVVQVLAPVAPAREGRPLRARWFGFDITSRPGPPAATPSRSPRASPETRASESPE